MRRQSEKTKITLVVVVALWFIALAVLTNQAKANDFDEAVTNKLAWENHELAADLSDYSVWALMAAPYIQAFKGEDKFKKVGTVTIVQLFNYTLVDSVKIRANRTRPNGHDTRSFYSGHTSGAFTAAGLMCMQGKYCLEGLALATATGYLRIAAKKHWSSDVLVGMGIGFLNGRYMPQIVVSY